MTKFRPNLRGLGAATFAVAALAVGATPAAAHIQVRPAEAAPLDPTLWTVLVPNEQNQATTRIEIKVPKGVVPFSFEDAPGWKRKLTYAPDKAIDTIVWTGQLPEQGLASFTFLATTPEREGQIAWKALQTYADGGTVRWIGPPDSDEPASFTTISKTTPRQNAGGEGASEGGDPADTAEAPTADTADAASTDSDSDTLPVVLGAVALIVAFAALAVALRGGRRRS